MLEAFRWVIWAIGWALAVLGLAGIPDNVAQWARWIKRAQPYVNQNRARWALCILAVLILLGPRGWHWINSPSQERIISNRFGELYHEGWMLLREIERASYPMTEERSLNWSHKVERFLNEHYGQARVAQFHDRSILPSKNIPKIFEDLNVDLWIEMEKHLRQLQKIIQDVAPKTPLLKP